MSQRHFNRRRFLTGLGLAGCSLVTTGAYGKVVGSSHLEIGRRTIQLSKKPNQQALKILHLSDLHASELVNLDFISRAIELGLSQKPDLICLTGDYITHQYRDWDAYAKVLSVLQKAAPTFATLGNHDGGVWCKKIHGYSSSKEVRDLLEKSEITLLDNCAKQVTAKDWKLNLVGLGDVWQRDFRPDDAFQNTTNDADAVTTVLSHNPDTKDPLQSYNWDLMLCGHTHGGQVNLPFIGAPIAPVKDKRFVKDLHRWDNRWIYITKGVGNLYGVRINCRPEVSLLTLV